MAISWDTKITNVNVNSKRATVTFTRTDDATGATWIKAYHNALIETSQQRTALLNAVWAAWQQQVTDDASIASFLDNLEQAANANLDAREV